jgi:hypothetical protein
MSAWSHLPNAAHIDRVIATLKKHPMIWNVDRNVIRNTAYNKARYAICTAFDEDKMREAAFDAALSAAFDEAWNAAFDEAWNARQDANSDADRWAAWDSAWDSARDALHALIAYDDCEQYLNMPSDQLRVLALLSEHSASVLLLPAVIAFEQIKELESV